MTEDDRSSRDTGDEELLQRAMQASEGDLRAFEELVERHQKRIAADCRYMTRDANSAEDLAQEIFVKAYFGLRTFEGRSSFRHWLQRIKVHHCLNYLKKQESMKQVALEEEIRADSVKLRVSPTADTNLEAMDDRRQIAAILDLLPSTLRLPLIMRDMDELSYNVIASELGISLSAAKMRIKRAREEFRARYELASSATKTSAHTSS